MLTSVVDKRAFVKCESCGKMTYHDLSNVTCKYSEEFGEYENLYLECPNCPTIEGFNMNLPVDELQDDLPLYEMPLNEEIQRYYVRLAMRIVREDFKSLA